VLIQYIDEHRELPWRHQHGDVSALDALYRAARTQFHTDPTFADRARSRVVRADTAAQRGNRVALCRLTGHTLAAGLNLLGIEAPKRL
jgi:hypothetical protein